VRPEELGLGDFADLSNRLLSAIPK